MSADHPEMVHLDNVRVDQIGDQASLPDEVLLEFLDRGVLLTDQLDGYCLAESAGPELDGLINHAHAAFGDLPDHLILELIEDVFK